MSRTLTELTEEAMTPPSASRAFLAEKLLETLDCEEDFAISEPWQSEVRNRCLELDHGSVQSIPAGFVFAGIRPSL